MKAFTLIPFVALEQRKREGFAVITSNTHTLLTSESFLPTRPGMAMTQVG